MDSYRHYAKKWLEKATKTEFNQTIEESNCTDEMRNIAFLKLIKKETYVALSLKFHCSPEHIRDVMREVYDKAYRVIKGGLI